MKNTNKSTIYAIAIVILVLLFVVLLTGCNRQLVDINYKFDEAIISLPNGDIIEGKVQSWRDYEDGDQIQVKIDGTTYLVHSSDIVLIKNG